MLQLSSFIEPDATIELYKIIYEFTISALRRVSKGENMYSPLIEKYQGLDIYEQSELKGDLFDRITKPPSATDCVTFKCRNADSVTISGDIAICLLVGDLDESTAFHDLLVILRYGIRRLEDELAKELRPRLVELLIADRFEVAVRGVTISAGESEHLAVLYDTVVVDEKGLTPPSEDTLDEGGHEYQRAREHYIGEEKVIKSVQKHTKAGTRQ